MENPEVSVIIPVYNAEKYVINSIKSVLDQDFKNSEIIIVNDASTDNSEQKIFENFKNEIEKGKIKYIKNKQNSGRNISANKGAEIATGKYLFFLDADDLWRENHISSLLKIFKEFNPDIIYTVPRTFINSEGKIKRISKKKLDRLEKLIFLSRIGFPSATAFKRENFIFYNPEFKFREDIELLLRAYLKGQKIFIADTNTVLIREHSSPDRMSKSSNFYVYTIKLYEEYFDKIPEKYKSYFLFHISEISFKFGDFNKGYAFLKEAIKRNPSILLDKRNFVRFIKRAIRIDKMLNS